MGLMELGCKLEDFGRPAQPAASNRLRCRARWCLSDWTPPTARHITPSGEWLGLRAEEGRGKRRNAPGRRMQPKNRGHPNETSHPTPQKVGCSFTEREPPERKHLSRGRKRNQNGIPLVAASETGTVQTESHAERHGRCRVKGSATSN